MNEKLAKILTYVTGIIGLIGFVFFIRIVMAGDDAIVEDEALQNGILSPFITFSIIALIATAGIAIIYSLLNLFKHPDVLKRTLLGVVALAVLFVVAYVIADNGAVTDQLGKVLEGGEAGSGSPGTYRG